MGRCVAYHACISWVTLLIVFQLYATIPTSADRQNHVALRSEEMALVYCSEAARESEAEMTGSKSHLGVTLILTIDSFPVFAQGNDVSRQRH